MISVISVFNNKNILEEWLLGSLRKQSSPYEFIGVDNTSGKFSSAAAALNWGAKRSKGEYLAFIHQDESLSGNDWLEKAEAFLRQVVDLGVAGVAGMLPSSRLSIWQVGTAPVENRLGLVASGPEKTLLRCKTVVTAPTAVQTLDEQVLMIPADVFSRLQFDEAACDNWHLYGVDYALSVGTLGLKAYVLPLPAHHKSLGFVDGRFLRTLKKIFQKHRNCKVIYTTSGSWYTNFMLDCAALSLMAARAEAGRWIGRNTTGGSLSLNRLNLLLRS
jgi:glycosyltransferase involved in cell wall biosynthesis